MLRHIEVDRVGGSRKKVRSLESVEPRKKKPVPKRPQQRVVEKRLSPLQVRVRDYLDAAYLRGQRKKDQNVRAERQSGVRGRKLLSAFMQTKDFQDFYEIAVREALKGASWNEDAHMFRGALFQAVVLGHLRETMSDSAQVLLVGRDVTKFTQLVNPAMTMVEYPYRQQAIDHTYVPDFLVLGLNNGKVAIDTYGEISLSTDSDKYMPQLNGFLHAKSRLGPLMRQARFRIITPFMDSPLGMPIVPGIEHVDTEFVPFTYPDFARFETEVNANYRKTPESLTLRQIRREAQVKVGRIREIGEPQFFRR